MGETLDILAKLKKSDLIKLSKPPSSKTSYSFQDWFDMHEDKDMRSYSGRVIPREEWGAVDPKDSTIPRLVLPVERIHYSFHRNWMQCFTQEECSRTLRKMQLREMNEYGFPDVRHNFMIGHDCNVYEGRGWNFLPKPANKHYYVWTDTAIDIGFFAENQYNMYPFEEMFKICDEFIEESIKKGLIIKDYILL